MSTLKVRGVRFCWGLFRPISEIRTLRALCSHTLPRPGVCCGVWCSVQSRCRCVSRVLYVSVHLKAIILPHVTGRAFAEHGGHGRWIRVSWQHPWDAALQHIATHCNTLQHTATHCNTLQFTATHCSTLQLTAGCARVKAGQQNGAAGWSGHSVYLYMYLYLHI